MTNDTRTLFDGLPQKYTTIVADPPWRQPTGGPRNSGSINPESARWARRTIRPCVLPYATMSVDEIKTLPVRDLAEQNAHLYLWVTNAYLEHAHDVVRAWGFRPGQVLVWTKTPRGLGLGGTFTSTTEFVLTGRRGSLKSLTRMDTSWFHWTRPHNNHSAKPEAFLDLVEQISPGPYLEMFSRRARLGWMTWGHESLHRTELAV